MKKSLLFICCIGLLPFAKAQDAGAKTKEVIIEKKVSKPSKDKVDSSMNVTVTINGDTTENIAILIDGDKITINGEEVVDANDPRLKKIKRNTVKGLTFQTKPDRENSNSNAFIFKKAPQRNSAYLGVVTEKADGGAKINEISASSPAAKANLKEEDVINKIDDQIITGPDELYKTIGLYKPNDKINLSYTRGNKTLKATIQLEKNPSPENTIILDEETLNFPSPNKNRYGFSFPELPNMDRLMSRAEKKPKLGISIEDLETGKGVRVTNVEMDSPAAKAGIQKGDILIQLDVAEITDVNFMKWQYYYPGQVLKMTLDRKGEKKTIEVKIPKKINTADL